MTYSGGSGAPYWSGAAPTSTGAGNYGPSPSGSFAPGMAMGGGGYGGGGAGGGYASKPGVTPFHAPFGGGGGGGLGWKNAYPVTPGNPYTVVVGNGGGIGSGPYGQSGGGTPAASGGAGAVRIIWGTGRSYPSTNTANASIII